MEKIKREISLFGASGHAKVIIDVILSNNTYRVGPIFDDDHTKKEIMEHIVFSSEKVKTFIENQFIIAIGDNRIRKKIAQDYGFSVSAPITHASAILSPSSSIGKGSVVMAQAVINAETIIGEHCIVNTGAIIEHDCKLENFVHISPNAILAGNVFVDEGSHIGIGACVLPNICIGKWATVGAGAVIIKNVPDYAVVVGNPGRIL